MNIISWNVNGIRAVEKKGFVDWLFASKADIVCLQETKANPSQLSENLIEPKNQNGESYFSAWASAKKAGYSGTAIYSKQKPDAVYCLGNADFDDEGRVLAADFGKLTVISAYFPNSQEAGARIDYKLGFCKAIFDFCNDLVKKGQNVVLSGDYNIAHKPIDLARPKQNEGNPGFLPEERQWMDFFTENGFCDIFRTFCTEENQFSWWSYRFKAREKNIGWRIDYHCVNNAFIENVKNATILSDVMGSDHCPVHIEIAD
ncbi:MAG: exodeoxyribonuclease III [Treponemataceae bacterium]